jgi:hypothetical protein
MCVCSLFCFFLLSLGRFSRRYRRKIYCQRFRKTLLTGTCLNPSPRRLFNAQLFANVLNREPLRMQRSHTLLHLLGNRGPGDPLALSFGPGHPRLDPFADERAFELRQPGDLLPSTGLLLLGVSWTP